MTVLLNTFITLILMVTLASNGYANNHSSKPWHDHASLTVAPYVRVVGNKLIDPYGNPLFLKIGAWVNLNNGSANGENYINFLSYASSIGVSEQNLWSLSVNMIFNHDPNRIKQVYTGERPIVTNELAHGSQLWRDDYIRLPANIKKYLAAFGQAKSKGHCGIAAASGININTLLNKTVKHVLRKLGGIE